MRLVWLFALIMLITLGSAAHVILTSSGGVLFTASSSASNFFNISVQVTDNTAAGNVTQVQVSLPSGFSYTSDSAGTSAAGSFSSLTWSNSSGLIMELTTHYFWFNATANTPGLYNFSIATVNASGTYYSNLSVNVSDASLPVSTFVSPGITGDANSTGSSISVNVSVSDYSSIGEILIRLHNASGLINSSRTYNSASNYIQFSGLANGIYKINSTFNDSVGNTNSSATLQVILDNVGPSVTLTLIDATQSSLNVSISASDSLTGISGTCSVSGEGNEVVSGNGTSQSFYVGSLDCNDEFSYTVTCRDGLNNPGEKTQTFSTDSCQSSGTTSGGDSGGGSDSSIETSWTLVESYDQEFQELENVSVSLEENERIEITLDNQNFFIGVVNIQSDSVKIKAGSIEKTVNLNGSEKFDLNDDDFYDVSVTLNEIYGEEAKIEVKYLHESSKSFGIEPNTQVLEGSKSKNILIMIGVAIFLVAVGALVFYRWHKNRTPRPKRHR